MKKISMLIALCAFLFSNQIISQDGYKEMRLSLIPERPDFVSNVINEVYQDSIGFLWYAKQDGLYRFDGYQYEVFKTFPSDGKGTLSAKNNCIVGFGSRFIYIGSDVGLNIYDYSKCKFKYVYPSDKSQNLFGLKNYGYENEVAWLAKTLGELMVNDIKEWGIMHENYHTDTGAPLAPSHEHVDENGKFVGFISWNLCIQNVLEGVIDDKWMLLQIES